jgi:hypothetical protein
MIRFWRLGSVLANSAPLMLDDSLDCMSTRNMNARMASLRMIARRMQSLRSVVRLKAQPGTRSSCELELPLPEGVEMSAKLMYRVLRAVPKRGLEGAKLLWTPTNGLMVISARTNAIACKKWINADQCQITCLGRHGCEHGAGFASKPKKWSYVQRSVYVYHIDRRTFHVRVYI